MPATERNSPVIQMRSAAETALIERFGREKASLPGAMAARMEAFERFAAKGLPTRRVESYHYTDLRNLMRGFAPPFAGNSIGIKPPADIAPRIRFFNGVLLDVLALPEGVSCEPLAAALEAGNVTLGAAMGAASDVVVDLNTALVREGVVIRVAPGRTIAPMIEIEAIDLISPGAAISAMPRVIVELGEGASLRLLETLKGSPGIAYQVISMLEIRLGRGAKAEHIRLNQAGDKAIVLSNLAVALAEEAEFSTLGVNLGAEMSRHQIFLNYQGENAKASLRGANMLRGSQHHDTTLVVDHAVPHGVSRELFKSVLDGAAQGVFQGKIIVRQYAQKTDGQMASNALLLSDEAGMSNKPELEIFADDVVCAHGATCGALDENQLFYLQARGIPKKEAEALLVEAFVAEALDEVADDALRDRLRGLVADWMRERSAA